MSYYSDPNYIRCTECLQKIQNGDLCLPVYFAPDFDDLPSQGYMHLYHFTQNPE